MDVNVKNLIAESAIDLIKTQNLAHYLCQLEEITALPRKYFQFLYLKPCLKLISHFQHIPNINDNEVYDGSSTSAVHVHLNRIIEGLRISTSRNHTYKSGELIKEISTYKVFFSLLIYNAGPLLTHRDVYYFQKGEKFRWNPLFHRSLQKDTEYRIGELRPVEKTTSLILIDRFFEKLSLEWLASLDPMFISSSYDPQKNTEIGDLISEIYPTEVKEAEAEIKNKKIVHLNEIKSVKEIQSKKDELGEDFLIWLKKAINTGEIKVNTKGAMVLKKERFIAISSPKIFQFYCSNILGSHLDVQESVLRLNKHIVNDSRTPKTAFHKVKNQSIEMQCILLQKDALGITPKMKKVSDKQMHLFGSSSEVPDNETVIKKFLKWCLEENVAHKAKETKRSFFRIQKFYAFVYPDLFIDYSMMTGDIGQKELLNILLEKNIHENSNTHQSEFFTINSQSLNNVKFIKINCSTVHKLVGIEEVKS